MTATLYRRLTWIARRKMGTEIRNDHSQEVMDITHKKILEALELCGQVAEGYAQVNLT